MRLVEFIRTVQESHGAWRAWYNPATEECVEIPPGDSDITVIETNPEKFEFHPDWNQDAILNHVWNRGWTRIGIQGNTSGYVQAHLRDDVRNAIEFLMNKVGNIKMIYAEWRRPSLRDIRLNDPTAIFKFIRNTAIPASESIDSNDEL